jgi:hypothetical protein
MIWHLVDRSIVGKAERYIATLRQVLKQSGFETEIALYADHGSNPWLDQSEAARASVRVLEGSFAGLSKALRYEGPGLLQTHGYKAGILGRVAARLAGFPVVTICYSDHRFGLPLNVYHWLDAWTSFLGERIVVSEAIKAPPPVPFHLHSKLDDAAKGGGRRYAAGSDWVYRAGEQRKRPIFSAPSRVVFRQGSNGTFTAMGLCGRNSSLILATPFVSMALLRT